MAPIYAAVHSEFDLRISKSFKDEHRDTLYEDLYSLTHEQNIRARETGAFAVVFKSQETHGIKNYLNERVHYFFSLSNNNTGHLTTQREEQELEPIPELNRTILAVNVGMSYWFSMLRGLGNAFTFDGEVVPIRNPRVGLVGFGSAHFNEKRVSRISTIIHEARHSDCTGGLNQNDLKKILDGQEDRVNPSCGHPHSRCSADMVLEDGKRHPLAGQVACDGGEYGPYFIEALYTAQIAEGFCTSCSEEDVQVAMISMYDSLSRVTKLQDFVAGNWAKPNMTSTGVIQKDEALSP